MSIQMQLNSPLRQMADSGIVLAGADAICTGLLAARYVAMRGAGRSGASRSARPPKQKSKGGCGCGGNCGK